MQEDEPNENTSDKNEEEEREMAVGQQGEKDEHEVCGGGSRDSPKATWHEQAMFSLLILVEMMICSCRYVDA